MPCNLFPPSLSSFSCFYRCLRCHGSTNTTTRTCVKLVTVQTRLTRVRFAVPLWSTIDRLINDHDPSKKINLPRRHLRYEPCKYINIIYTEEKKIKKEASHIFFEIIYCKLLLLTLSFFFCIVRLRITFPTLCRHYSLFFLSDRNEALNGPPSRSSFFSPQTCAPFDCACAHAFIQSFEFLDWKLTFWVETFWNIFCQTLLTFLYYISYKLFICVCY